MVSGVHGSAWTSVAKDIMILAVVVFLGIYLPLHYYGGLRRDVRGDRSGQAGFPRAAAARREPRGGSPRPCCSPRSASTCGRTLRLDLHRAKRSA